MFAGEGFAGANVWGGAGEKEDGALERDIFLLAVVDARRVGQVCLGGGRAPVEDKRENAIRVRSPA